MKKFFGPFLTVLFFGLFLVGNVNAQTAITTFPYTADFGTTASPGADNAKWQFKSFNSDGELQNTSTQWNISAIAEGRLAVCFSQDNYATETMPTAFTPVLRLEKADNTSYAIHVTYSVPVEPTKRTLVMRLHTADASGEPYYEYGVGTKQYQYEDSIKDSDGKVRSVLLQNYQGVPKNGVSEYTYYVSSDLIPENGDYRISFLIDRPAEKSIKAGEKLYISAFRVEKIENVDLAAGQIISPYTDSKADAQAFSAFVMNRGGGIVKNFTACYQVDGSEPVQENFSNVNIFPDGICRIAFKRLPDLQTGNHTLKFWLAHADDMNRSNDTASCLIKAGTAAIATMPANYRFTEEKPYGWTMYSDSFYAEPAWRFVKEENKNLPYVSTDKPNGNRNNDWLISPQFNFEKGKMYRMEFTYKAVLETGDIMGDKSLALYMCKNAGRDSLSFQELVWKQDRFEYTGNRRMVVYYRAKENAVRTLAFHTYGPATNGGLQLQGVSVSKAEINELDYFFDFDGSSSEEPEYLVEKNLDFVDYDGNVSDAGTPGNWELWGNQSGYNSQYSARSIGLRGQTNDWIVFNPFYLEADKDYYLSFRATMGQNNADHNGSLEYYVLADGPRYDLDYGQQPGIKGKKTVAGDYDTVRRVFTVSESGYYLLSIRNVTENPEQTDLEREKNYTVFVDNVSLSTEERTAVQAMYANVPYEARFGQTVTLSMTFRNFSLVKVPADSIAFCYQIDSGEVCRETPVTDALPQVSNNYTFSRKASFSKDKDQTVRFWVEMKGSSEKPDYVEVRVNKIQAKELPFVERFAEKSMDDWQSYPDSRRQWQMQFGSETAHSGEWAVKYQTGASAFSDFLVSPLLRVEQGKTYRVSFFGKRGGNNVGANDSLRLFYAYNRYDNTGFIRQLAVFPKPENTDYDFYHAYVRFPDSGVVFLGLEARLEGNTDPLYIDDFVLVDSLHTTISDYVVSDLLVSGNMSECDTMAIGRVSFKITAGGFSMPETIRAYISYDDAPAKDISFHKEMMDGEEVELSFTMPMFSGGEHRVRAWIGLPEEVNRTDDTVSATFNVHTPQVMPFRDGDIRVVGSPRMSSCFELDSTGIYILRYRYDATEAEGASVRLNLLTYGGNRIVNARQVDEQTNVSGIQTVEKEITLREVSVFAFGVECSGLPVGGVFRIDSIWFEAKPAFVPDTNVNDTTAIGTFAADEFRLQPNPASDLVEIVVPAQAQHLDIFDMQGRVCRHFALRKQPVLRVSLQGLKAGVYMVRVSGDRKAATLKLIKR
ncbi:MAG: T9SS type A sorting domain-containing protein [Bacteroidales bacterium]|nr:T9SS type A sorting domain-containing protein [Bacteroidales bacterium]